MKKLYIAVNNYELTQGINSVVDQFMCNKDLLLKKGIEVIGVIDCKRFYSKIPNRCGTCYELKNKKILKNITHKYYWGNVIAIYRAFNHVGKQTVKVLKRSAGSVLNNEDTIILFQDPYAAFYAIKKLKIKNGLFMSHAFEDELEQLELNYPQIIGRSFENKIRKIYKSIYNNYGIVTICHKAEDWVINHNTETRTYVLYNTVSAEIDTNDNTSESDNCNQINIVMASSINTRKGFDLLLEAIKQMDAKTINRVKMHIFGDGPYLANIKRYCQESKCESLVLYGRTERPYLRYGEMDAFLMTSRSETLPMGILEAMECGLPIFSTNVGAINELVIDDYNGKLFEPTVDDIKNAFEYIIENVGLLKEYGNNSKKRFEDQFSPNEWVEEFSSIIDKEIMYNARK